MIDTICLVVPKSKIITLDLIHQGVSGWDLQSKTAQYTKVVKNPSKKDTDSGLYFPHLTGYRRTIYGIEEAAHIEFSIPKLLFTNNLDEVGDKDFREIIDTLHERLKIMGIVIQKTTLENASVRAVHFSKNIELEGGYTASHLISEMNKVNLRKTFDFARSRYINDGESLYAHTTSHQLVIYDKIADLAKGKKRAIDKDQTLYQRSLFSELKKKRKLEIIRFEVRLSKKQKMNQVLQDLGYKKNPVFQEIFKKEIAQKVVQDYWKKLIKERNLGLFSISLSQKDILRTLYLAKSDLKPKQAIYFLGLYMVGKDENGMRELRSIVTKKSHERSWYRLAKDMQIASELITKNKLRDWVLQIDKGLHEFKTYKQTKLSTEKIEV